MSGGGAFDRDFELFGVEFCKTQEHSVSFSAGMSEYEAQANNSPHLDHEMCLI